MTSGSGYGSGDLPDQSRGAYGGMPVWARAANADAAGTSAVPRNTRRFTVEEGMSMC